MLYDLKLKSVTDKPHTEECHDRNKLPGVCNTRAGVSNWNICFQFYGGDAVDLIVLNSGAATGLWAGWRKVCWAEKECTHANGTPKKEIWNWINFNVMGSVKMTWK